MKRALSLVIFSLLGLMAIAQETAGETAKSFIRKGDYNNAILVLNRAVEADKHNVGLRNDLAFAYYLQRDYTKALSAIRPVAESKDADIQSFQIAGMIYKSIEDRKEAERAYKDGLKRFPRSGALYNEYGELLWSNTDFLEAVKQWLKGIQYDPGYSGNYYNASKYYYMSADRIWLIYGEIFVNLESFTSRTPEIKTMLLEGYKKLFSETDIDKGQDTKNEFVKAYLEVMKGQLQVVGSGITPDALSALRTRFILEWSDKHAAQMPFRLFEYHQQLAGSGGLFDAYNQWIFGAANNLSAFQQWTVAHSEEYARFTHFQKNRVFKVPEGQYYNNKP